MKSKKPFVNDIEQNQLFFENRHYLKDNNISLLCIAYKFKAFLLVTLYVFEKWREVLNVIRKTAIFQTANVLCLVFSGGRM